MNKKNLMKRCIASYVSTLLVLCGLLSSAVVPRVAQATGGLCKWEGGPGIDISCPAQDCVADGGAAECVLPVIVPSSPKTRDQVDGDMYHYGICDEYPPYVSRYVNWCVTAYGTWMGNSAEVQCVGRPAEFLPPLKQEGILVPWAKRFVWGMDGAPDCPASMADSSWGHNPSGEATHCWNDSPKAKNGISTLAFRKLTFTGMKRSYDGQCTTPLNEIIYLRRDRGVDCPLGYSKGIKPNGDLHCYRPADATCPGPNGVRPGSGSFIQKEPMGEMSPVNPQPVLNFNSTGGIASSSAQSAASSQGASLSAALKSGAAGYAHLQTGADFWRHTYQRDVVLAANGHKSIGFPDGIVRHFAADGTELQNRDGAAYRFVTQPDGTHLLTTKEGDKELYSAAGRLLRLESRAGLGTDLHYDAAGRLEAVEGHFGATTVFTYNNQGQLDTVVAPDGKTTRLEYATTGSLSRMTFPDGTSRTYQYEDTVNPWLLTGVTDEANVRIRTVAYDSKGRVTSVTGPNGIDREAFGYPTSTKTTISDALGTVRNHDYAVRGGVLKQTSISQPCGACGGTNQSVSYDAAGNVDTRIEFGGARTDYDFDAQNREILRTEGLSSTGAVSDATRSVATTAWHPTYRLPLRQELRDHTGATYRVVTFDYDARGNLRTRTETAGALQRTWTYTHDALGRVATVDGPRTDVDDVTTMAYYADDDACVGCRGQLKTTTNALGHVARNEAYDAAGRVLAVRDPNGVLTRLTYDARGRIQTRTSDAEGQAATTTYSYDARGLLESVTTPTTVVRYGYDAAHRLTSIEDGAGNRVEYVLDKLGNRLEENVKDASGTLQERSRSEFDALGQLTRQIQGMGQGTSFEYDGAGNVVAEQNPNLGLTTSTYDVRGRLRSTKDALRGQTQFTYDADDRIATVTDAMALTTTYRYNGLGDQTELQSPDTGVTTYEPDSAGNSVAKTDARGVRATYGYDVLGRLVSEQFPTSPAVTYAYDEPDAVTGCVGSHPIGRLTRMTDGSGSTRYCYDADGRVTSKRQVTGAITLQVRYEYDGDGQLTMVGYPSGGELRYTRDAAGRIASATWTHNGTSQPVATSIDYDARGRMLGVDLTAGAQQRRYDAAGRPASIDAPLALASAPRNYGYDEVGRLTRSSDSAGQVLEGFEYDAIGNRLIETTPAGTKPYGYTPGTHRLGSVAGVARQYDAMGSLTDRGDGWTFAYDDRQRLETTSLNGAEQQRNHYNGRGERVTRIGGVGMGGVAHRHFLYDERGQLLAEYLKGDTGQPIPVMEYLWVDGTLVALGEAGSGYGSGSLAVVTDHLGSPRGVTRKVGANVQPVWAWSLSGSVFGTTGPVPDVDGDGGVLQFNLRFPGQYSDGESGINYNYFRDYEPGTGRYIESDPIGLAGGISTYGYALQNPLVLFDPDGLKAWYCQRPLCPEGTNCTTGERGPPVTNHQYLCVTRIDGSIECGGQSSDNPTDFTSPGRPTRPDEDSYNQNTCDEVDNEDDRCVEACLLTNFNKPRPTYGVGPQGVDCQEWAADTLWGCRAHCRRPINIEQFQDR